MAFPQLGYPQFLSAAHEVYAGERPASAREGGTEGGVGSSASAAAVGSMLGMYGSPWAQNYSAFLPYSGAADLALISQMVRAALHFGCFGLIVRKFTISSIQLCNCTRGIFGNRIIGSYFLCLNVKLLLEN